MFLLGALSLLAACVALAVAVGVVGASDKVVVARLDTARSTRQHEPEGDSPDLLVENKRSGLTRFLASATAVRKIERNIMLAGRPPGWTLRRILVLKPALSAVGLMTLAAVASDGGSALGWVVGVGATVACFFAPDAIISRRAQDRQLQIQHDLPDVLDQVTISVEAGLSFEAAFARIGERRRGPLADEIVRTVQDMRLGMSRREAYQALADRTDVEDLRSFVKAVTQGEQYGVSISSIVRNQSEEMRMRRKTRAEATAQKVPVKILFPLITCIFPVLMVVVLAPAFINLADTLTNGDL
jgi:tight adherence protein C